MWKHFVTKWRHFSNIVEFLVDFVVTINTSVDVDKEVQTLIKVLHKTLRESEKEVLRKREYSNQLPPRIMYLIRKGTLFARSGKDTGASPQAQ